MHEIAPRLYLAGPMTGYPGWNHPAFHAAANRLRGVGFTVFNPANYPPDDLDWAGCLRRALHEVLDAEAIAVLPGWKSSRGARLEVYVARTLGMTVRAVDEWLEKGLAVS